MTSTTRDQITGFSGSLAVKPPVRLATTVPVTLEGLIVIDGVQSVDGDRILVKDQADASQNGIYIASSGLWSRAVDFDATGKVARGTMTLVGDGPQVGLWMVTTADPVVLGLSDVSFGKVFSAPALGAMISGATAKATPVDADLLGMADSADGDASKKTTFLQVWANYFKGKADALYQPVKTILTTLGNLANGAGVLTNNGSGTLSWGAAGGWDLAGQTWQDVSASRVGNNTSYQNTSGKPIVVAVAWTNSGPNFGGLAVSSNNSTWVNVGPRVSSTGNAVTAIIPVNWYYRLTDGDSGPIQTWAELR